MMKIGKKRILIDLRKRMKWFYWFYLFENILSSFFSIYISTCVIVLCDTVILNIFLSAAWRSNISIRYLYFYIDSSFVVHFYPLIIIIHIFICIFSFQQTPVVVFSSCEWFLCENESIHCCLQTMVTIYHSTEGRYTMYNLKCVRRLIIYLLLWNFFGISGVFYPSQL